MAFRWLRPHVPPIARRIALSAAIGLAVSPSLVAQSSDSLAKGIPAVMTDSAIAAGLGYRAIPRNAVILGAMVPGLGHLYAGEWLKSYPIFVLTASNLLLGSVIFNLDRCTFDFLGSDNCRPGVPIGSRITGALMVGSGIYLWIRSAIDAGHAVERQRTRRAQSVPIRRVDSPPPSEPPQR